MGEIWHDAEPWLQGDQFDAVMNYHFTNQVVDFFAKDSINASQFAERMTEVIHMYTDKNNEVAFNLVDSHDTARILTTANNRIDRVKLVYLFQFLFTGTPCVYYGGEIGMTGGHDSGCRACMIWDQSKQDRDLFQFIKSIITLRYTRDVCRYGTYSFLKHDPKNKVIVFEKATDKEQLIVMMNLNDNSSEVNIKINHSFVEIIYDGQEFNEIAVYKQQSLSIKSNYFRIFYKQLEEA